MACREQSWFFSRHVTLAPARELEANELLDCLNKVSIPALELLPWVLKQGDVNPFVTCGDLSYQSEADYWREDKMMSENAEEDGT